MDRRRKNFLARGGLASADEMLDALASGVAGDEAGVMGEIDNEPGGSGTAGVSASASGGDGLVGVRSVRPTAAASGEMDGVAVDRAGNGPGQAMGSPRVAADLTASGPTDGPGVGGYGLESAADGSVGPNVVDVEGRRGGPRVVGTELEPLFPPGLPEEVVNVGIGRGTLLEPLMGRPTTDSTMGDQPLISRVRDAVVGLSTGMSQRVSQAVDMFPIHTPPEAGGQSSSALDGATGASGFNSALDGAFGASGSQRVLGALDGAARASQSLGALDGATSASGFQCALDGATSASAVHGALDGATSASAVQGFLDGAASASRVQGFLDGAVGASRVQSALGGANDAPGQHVMGMGDGWFHGSMPSQPQQPQMSPFWSPQRRGYERLGMELESCQLMEGQRPGSLSVQPTMGQQQLWVDEKGVHHVRDAPVAKSNSETPNKDVVMDPVELFRLRCLREAEEKFRAGIQSLNQKSQSSHGSFATAVEDDGFIPPPPPGPPPASPPRAMGGVWEHQRLGWFQWVEVGVSLHSHLCHRCHRCQGWEVVMGVMVMGMTVWG